jgi:hypothetical protein
MKKSSLFRKFALIPLISTLVFFINSLIEYYPWNTNSWFFLFDFYYYTNFGSDYVFIAYLILIGLFVSVTFLIKNTIKVFKYSGFPSIKEAKSYYDLASKIKEKQRLDKVNREYQIKLAKLEEEKKKYL